MQRRGRRSQRVRRGRAAPPAPRAPRGRDRRRSPAASNAGDAARRAAAAPGAARRPGARADGRSRPSRGTTSSSSRCRTAQSGRDRRRSWPTTSSSSTAAPTTGSPTRAAWEQFYGGEHAGTWPYGLPELARPARRAARRHPDRRPRLLPDDRHARPRPGARRRTCVEPDVVVVAASGTSGAGKAAKPHLLGSEVMGQRQRVRRRRASTGTPPRSIQNLAAARRRPVRCQLHADARRRCRAASSPPARHRCADGVDRRAGVRRLRGGLRRRAVRPRAPRRSVAADQGGRSAPTPCTSRSPSTRPPAGSSPSARVDNLTKGTAGAAVQCLNLALGLPETHRPDRPWGWRRDRADGTPRPAYPRGRWPCVPAAGRCRGACLGGARSSVLSITATATETSVGLRGGRSVADRGRRRSQKAVHRLRGAGTAGLLADRGAGRHCSTPLADAGITVLTQSTFDTDWILVPAARGRPRDRRTGDERGTAAHTVPHRYRGSGPP